MEMRRILGFVLLAVGFLGVFAHVLLYAYHAKRMVLGIEIEDRVHQPHEVQHIKAAVFDGMKRTQRRVLLPASVMLAGGILLGWGGKANSGFEQSPSADVEDAAAGP